jgi:tetratricopeptide (TPR) repeat protein
MLIASSLSRAPACVDGNYTQLFPSRRSRLLIALALALVTQWAPQTCANASSYAASDQVCDPLADYYLGMEDYPQAIRRHEIVVKADPNNALAYYHLGFAYGIIGDHRAELADYQKAVELGLSDWQLFLNMGLLYLDGAQFDNATAVLRIATLLGPYHPETHFNLGLAYDRIGFYPQAEQEILLSLRLDPNQLDARNQLGVIYAEEGNYQRAHEEWKDLAGSNPDYSPARANLVILEQVERGEVKGPQRMSGFAHAP